MFRWLQLLAAPLSGWTRILDAQRPVLLVFLLAPLPLLLFGTALESYGLLRWGDVRGEFGHRGHVSRDLVLHYQQVRLLADLLVLFLGAKVIQWTAGGLHFATTYTRCFTLQAYALSPVFFLRSLDAVPMIHTWLVWGVSILLALSLLYHGVAIVLQPQQTKGFGLFLLTSLVVTSLSGLAHLVGWATLHGRLFPLPTGS